MSDEVRDRIVEAVDGKPFGLYGGLVVGPRLAENIADALTPMVNALQAAAWDEGHRTKRVRDTEPPFCQCSAWSESECGCGNYGRTVDAPNPYSRTASL